MRVHMGDEFQYTNEVQGRTFGCRVSLHATNKLLGIRGVPKTQARPGTWLARAFIRMGRRGVMKHERLIVSV